MARAPSRRSSNAARRAAKSRPSLSSAATVPRARSAVMGPIAVDPDSWVKSSTGLQYLDEKVGSGDSPKDGDVVKVDYTGWLEATGSAGRAG